MKSTSDGKSAAFFVKSATTTTPVAKSRADIMEMIERYGGTGFGYETRGDVVLATFTVPGRDGNALTISYPVNVVHVLQRLTAQTSSWRKAQKKGPPDRDQAERVAWRILYELIDAAFAAASIGASTVEDAFHAHVVIESTDGSRGRLADYVATLRAASGGALPSASSLRQLKGGS